MKTRMQCLIVYIISFVIASWTCIALSDEMDISSPITIKDSLTGSLLAKLFPDDDYIDRFIQKPNDAIRTQGLTFMLKEVVADPISMKTIVSCTSADPDIELRGWYGAEFDLPDVLNHLNEAADHPILYVSISPVAPYQEEALEAVVQNNRVYRYSGCLNINWHNINEEEKLLEDCIIGEPYTVDEMFSVDLIRMYAGEWQRITDQIVFSIPVLPVIDSFTFAKQIELANDDLIDSEASIYLTPIDRYFFETVHSVKNENNRYDLVVQPNFKLGTKLPDTIIIHIRDEFGVIVYSEKWTRCEEMTYLQQNEKSKY